jgi:EAL domain-containing protein (putative c-di-GMP-specific phosphodiesterase class I)
LSLSDETMLAFISEQFVKWAIPTHKICFEITETAVIANLSYATKFINHLRDKGCLFSLDDFGSGLSSFAYLKNLPVDFLKIDGSFVKDILDDKIDLAMVKSINEVGHIMGKKTIAEFVENEKIFSLLNKLGVDYAQGYYISKPVALDKLSQIILPTYRHED